MGFAALRAYERCVSLVQHGELRSQAQPLMPARSQLFSQVPVGFSDGLLGRIGVHMEKLVEIGGRD